jgi:hypothetical protein
MAAETFFFATEVSLCWFDQKCWRIPVGHLKLSKYHYEYGQGFDPLNSE